MLLFGTNTQINELFITTLDKDVCVRPQIFFTTYGASYWNGRCHHDRVLCKWLIPLSAHHQPQRPLVRHPIIPSREQAESFLTFRRRDSFWWQRRRDQIEFDICCRDAWQAGKQRSVWGALAPEQSPVRGNPAAYVTHGAGFITPCSSFNWRYQKLFSISFVFLVFSHPFFSSRLPPSPNFTAHLLHGVFFLLSHESSAAWNRTP